MKKPRQPTPDEAIKAQLQEWLEEFVVIGFLPGSGVPIVVSQVNNPKGVLAINALMDQLIADGGIGVTDEA